MNICPLLKPPTTWRVVKGSLGRRGYNGWNICPCVCLCVCVCVKPRSCLAPLNRIKRLDMCFPLSGFSLPTSSGMLGGFSGRLFFFCDIAISSCSSLPGAVFLFVCLFIVYLASCEIDLAHLHNIGVLIDSDLLARMSRRARLLQRPQRVPVSYFHSFA